MMSKIICVGAPSIAVPVTLMYTVSAATKNISQRSSSVKLHWSGIRPVGSIVLMSVQHPTPQKTVRVCQQCVAAVRACANREQARAQSTAA